MSQRGRRRYDDFVEIGTDAAIALEKSLEKRYETSSQSSSGEGFGYGFVQFISNVVQGRNRQGSRADTEQGPGVESTDNLQNPSTNSQAVLYQLSMVYCTKYWNGISSTRKSASHSYEIFWLHRYLHAYS